MAKGHSSDKLSDLDFTPPIHTGAKIKLPLHFEQDTHFLSKKDRLIYFHVSAVLLKILIKDYFM